MKKDYKRNPEGKNQLVIRSNEEFQKIIDDSPEDWTAKDFRGEGVNNKKKILTKTETERSGIKFYFTGKKKKPLKEVYKHSSPESISEFDKKLISEEEFRNRAKAKMFRDLMPLNEKKKMYKERHKNLTDRQKKEKRRRDREYRERQKKLLRK